MVLDLGRAFRTQEVGSNGQPELSLASVVGELLQIMGSSARVHWLDNTESTVSCKEVRTLLALPPACSMCLALPDMPASLLATHAFSMIYSHR